MLQLILVFHVLIAIALIVLVLIQQGKGAQMGAAFGSGASQTLFGSQGSSSFLLKITALFAALFFMTSLTLGYIASQQTRQDPLQALTSQAASKQKAATSNAPKEMSAPIIPNAGVPIPAGERLPPPDSKAPAQ